MKKLIVIEFSQEWILKHRTDEALPIALIERELAKTLKLEVQNKTFAQITLMVDDESLTENKIKANVDAILQANYPDDYADIVWNCRIDEIAPEESTNDSNGSDADENELKSLGASLAQQSQRTREAVNGQPSTALAQIDNLVGAVDFKQIAHEIVQIAPEIRSRKTYDVFTSQCYLFSIGDGCGSTTCIELLSKLIAEMRIKEGVNVREAVEFKLPPDRDALGYDPFEEIKEVISKSRPNELRVMCVDICEWMNFTERARFREFLRLVEKASDRFVVVFRIPFVEHDVLERIKMSLDDLLYVRTVTFPPLSAGELQLGAKKTLKGYGFTVQKSAWQYFDQRIAIEKSDGKFYEMSTVKKIVGELIYKKQLSNAKRGKPSSVITASDMRSICAAEAIDPNVSGEAQLKALIGNDKVRARLDEVLAQIQLAMLNGNERPCIHMRFVGNPGTGKTTVARILGKILKERGILRIGNFYEYAGRDFCGRYVGETAPKTSSMCRDAYGSVLFIDEAYTLYKEGSSADYGREAIDTLIAEMENHRNDFVVIMAGYTDEMNELMKGNLGLASRMPYTIEFPNFTRDELYEIFESMVKSKFKYDDNILTAARNYFTNLPDDVISAKSFSNARYVRNLFERTWAKASLRSQFENKAEVSLTKDDFDRASGDSEFAKLPPKRNRIGF